MKKCVLSLAIVAFAAFALARCSSVFDVTITLTDAAAQRAFLCNVPDSGLLLDRLQGQQAMIVLDVIDLGTDIVSCRPSEVVDHCRASACGVMKRACYPVGPGDDSLDTLFATLRAEDAGISGIPTDRTVMVRLVATSECPPPNVALDPTLAGGCAYSCPTKLSASGTIDLDLDTVFAPQCEIAVEYCTSFPPP